jgi:hypothetical protein
LNLKTGGAENLLKNMVDSNPDQIIVTLDDKEVSDVGKWMAIKNIPLALDIIEYLLKIKKKSLDL